MSTAPSALALDRVIGNCAHEALPCPAVKLELVVYERAALTNPGARPRWSLNFNTGERVHHVGFDPDAEPAHWFVLDLAFARRHGRPLVGPAPHELIGAVDDKAVERALDVMVEWYDGHEPAAAETARRRAAHWRATGTFMTKTGATLGAAPP